jgi:hypothetical protein
MQPLDRLAEVWSPTMPPPIVRLLRPEDLAPAEPLVDMMAFSAAIFAVVGVGLIVVGFARRRTSELDCAMRRLSRTMNLPRQAIHTLRQIAPLAGDAHPVALLVSRHALRTAVERARNAVNVGALRINATALDALEGAVIGPSRTQAL